MDRMKAVVNGWRWRLARSVAPDPIVAAPRGDAKVYIFMRLDDGGGAYHTASAWFETSAFEMSLSNKLAPLIGDEFALATSFGPAGTFSGTIGETA